MGNFLIFVGIVLVLAVGGFLCEGLDFDMGSLKAFFGRFFERICRFLMLPVVFVWCVSKGISEGDFGRYLDRAAFGELLFGRGSKWQKE